MDRKHTTIQLTIDSSVTKLRGKATRRWRIKIVLSVQELFAFKDLWNTVVRLIEELLYKL